MKIYILILALLPVVCFLVWIYYKDKYEKEPVAKLVQYFFMGIGGVYTSGVKTLQGR